MPKRVPIYGDTVSGSIQNIDEVQETDMIDVTTYNTPTQTENNEDSENHNS